MSWLFSSSPSEPSGPNFHPITQNTDIPNFGKLETKDTEWFGQTSSFITETQTFYATTPDGGLIMGQIIHSSVGLWYPQINVTFRYHNASKSQTIWKSVAVKNFSIQADRRSCKSDQASITYDPSTNTYNMQASYDNDVQISWTVASLADGWKFKPGERGGMSYFGNLSPDSTSGEPDYKAGSDGFMIHRFWPRCSFTGITRIGTDVVDMEGARGVFIHAIQGIRPNLAACRWNFSDFQTVGTEDKDRISLIQMEFETTTQYGRKKVNIGSIVVGDKLLGVVGGEESTCTHEEIVLDEQTGYNAPGKIIWNYKGKAIGLEGREDGDLEARVELPLLESGQGYLTKGLIEKVDVLGEIPGFIKGVISYAAGTKPFIYQWFNPAVAVLTIPATLVPGATGEETGSQTVEVRGHVFNEATYISEP